MNSLREFLRTLHINPRTWTVFRLSRPPPRLTLLGTSVDSSHNVRRGGERGGWGSLGGVGHIVGYPRTRVNKQGFVVTCPVLLLVHRCRQRCDLATRAYRTDGPASEACDGARIAPKVVLVPSFVLKTCYGRLRAVRADIRYRATTGHRAPDFSLADEPSDHGRSIRLAARFAAPIGPVRCRPFAARAVLTWSARARSELCISGGRAIPATWRVQAVESVHPARRRSIDQFRATRTALDRVENRFRTFGALRALRASRAARQLAVQSATCRTVLASLRDLDSWS